MKTDRPMRSAITDIDANNCYEVAIPRTLGSNSPNYRVISRQLLHGYNGGTFTGYCPDSRRRLLSRLNT